MSVVIYLLMCIKFGKGLVEDTIRIGKPVLISRVLF